MPILGRRDFWRPGAKMRKHTKPARWLEFTFALGLLVIMSGTVFAQKKKGDKLPGPQTHTVTTPDGWILPFDYYYPVPENAPEAITQNLPTVILLHGAGENRSVWKSLATKLQRAGFVVAAIDLRKHGESRPPRGYRGSLTQLTDADFAGMMLDLAALKGFLLVEHQQKNLNIRKTAIIAADKMVPVAMNFAVADWLQAPYPDAPVLAARTPRGQDIRALAMLSPSRTAGRLGVNRTARMLQNDAWMVAAWIGVGAADDKDDGTAKLIYEALTAGNPVAKERVILENYKRVKVRGTELMNVNDINVENQLVQFMRTYLLALEAPWQSRISPLAK